MATIFVTEKLALIDKKIQCGISVSRLNVEKLKSKMYSE